MLLSQVISVNKLGLLSKDVTLQIRNSDGIYRPKIYKIVYGMLTLIINNLVKLYLYYFKNYREKFMFNFVLGK